MNGKCRSHKRQTLGAHSEVFPQGIFVYDYFDLLGVAIYQALWSITVDHDYNIKNSI